MHQVLCANVGVIDHIHLLGCIPNRNKDSFKLLIEWFLILQSKSVVHFSNF